MENTLSSSNSLFWSKLGIWQFLATALTLAIFFITLHFTDDMEATSVLAVIIYIPCGIIWSYLDSIDCSYESDAVNSSFCLVSFPIVCFSNIPGLLGFWFLLVFAFSGLFATVSVIYEAGRYGISEAVVLLSFTVEVIVVVLFMWLAH